MKYLIEHVSEDRFSKGKEKRVSR
ncbi:Protein of unknown function [Bacillus toyonensis]|nr:Protein of unknown function [Bacillus toyonensis]